MEKMKRIFVCLAAFALTGLTAFAATTSVDVTVAAGETIVVNAPNDSSSAKRSGLRATIGNDKIVSNANLGSTSVSAGGSVIVTIIAGNATGKTTVTVQYTTSSWFASYTTMCMINVTVTEAFPKSSVTLVSGQSLTYATAEKSTKLAYESSNASVVTVSAGETFGTASRGTVTITGKGSSVGTADVTIKDATDKVIKKIAVTVIPTSTSYTAVAVEKGKTAKATKRTDYTSKSPSATIDFGDGNATVALSPTTFSSRNKTLTSTFTGKAVGDTGFTMKYNKTTLIASYLAQVYETKSVSASADAGTPLEVTCESGALGVWSASSSASDVATVTLVNPTYCSDWTTATITGLKEGTATITVKNAYCTETIKVLVTARPVVRIGGTDYPTLDAALKSVTADGTVLTILDESVVTYSDGKLHSGGEEVDLSAYGLALVEGEGGSLVLSRDFSLGELRISEICPSPANLDPNGLESGWVELVNAGKGWVDIGAYELQRFNRGKKASAGKFKNLPSQVLAPGARVLVYTSDRYPHGEDSAWVGGDGDGETVETYDGLIVLPAKVSPKKYPMVRLLKGETVVDTVLVPVDTPDNGAIIVMDPDPEDRGGITRRYLTDKPTPGAANDLRGAVELGPNVGPLFGVKHSLSDIVPTAPASPDADYPVTLDVNPVHGGVAADEIAAVKLVYRVGLGGEEQELDMAKGGSDKEHGQQWTAEIPQSALASAGRGQLIQWKARITDAGGNEWTSPRLLNPDDGYEWYGTIVEPSADQLSATLGTMHLFADADVADTPGQHVTSALMNVDYDEFMTSSSYATKRKTHPYGARCVIYDSATSNCYDNVRIDLRGNSSADFKKKSHGFKFNKAHPLQLATPLTTPAWTKDGKPVEVKEIRKTSFIAEFADPSYLRQQTSFWLFNEAGSPAPFDYPVRLNLNGKFYQMGFHSARFSDELLEDVYGFDKYGYGYKNVGTFMNYSTAGGIEKKSPDDGNEGDLSELNALCEYIKAADNVVESKDGSSKTGLDNADLTKRVVEKFDLAAWINYLALTRITHETDDVWANLSACYDNPKMKSGERGTGTWRPLVYDTNLSFGQYYYNNAKFTRPLLMADKDTFKSHPFYGGMRVRCYDASNNRIMNPNRAFEAVWQSAKFRRLYLRRLRTLMDEYLKAPGTAKADTPLWVKMQELVTLMGDDATKDRALWGPLNTTSAGEGAPELNVWGAADKQPTSAQAGLDEIWEKYIVPRRTHLYVTHSISNKTKTVGYGANCNAGIPLAQSPIANLKDGITAEYNATLGAVVIRNANAETIDISGWKVAGPVEMTIPSGTVLDQKNGTTSGEVYVTADRRLTISKMTLSDQVVVGNGTTGKSDAKIALTAADGTKVIYVPTPESQYLRLHSFDGVPANSADGDAGEWIVLTNISTDVKLDLSGVKVQFLKAGESKAKCVFTIAVDTKLKAGKSIRFDQVEIGWEKITNGDLEISIFDADGVMAQYSTVRQKGIVGYCDKDGNAGPAYLRATSFESENKDGFEAVSVPMPIDEEQASAFDVEVLYDGTGFTIDTNGLVAAARALPGAADPKIDYALTKEGPYQDEPFVFTNVCVTSFWYRISSVGYESFVHEARVTINPKPTITITIEQGDEITDVMMDGESVDDELELPAETTQVELTLEADGLTVPVFKVVRGNVTNVTSKTATYPIEDGDTLEFFAEEAEWTDPDVTEKQVKDAIIEAIDDENKEAVGPKIDAVVDIAETPAPNKVSAKEMAAWIADNEISSADMAFSDYLVASVKFGTDEPITDEKAEVEFTEVEASTSDGFVFDFGLKIDEDPQSLTLVKEFVAGCIQSTGDLGDGFEVIGDPGRVVIGDDGRVTITPDPTKSAEFFKIVIPKDPGAK